MNCNNCDSSEITANASISSISLERFNRNANFMNFLLTMCSDD